MTRSDLIARLAELHPQLLAKDAELAVKVILDSLSSTLSSGGPVQCREPGPDRAVGRHRCGRGREGDPRWRVQAAQLALQLPGNGRSWTGDFA